MILTKQAQESLISNYVKSGKNQDECIGFIDGVEAMNKLIGDRSKVEKAAPELLEALIKCREWYDKNGMDYEIGLPNCFIKAKEVINNTIN